MTKIPRYKRQRNKETEIQITKKQRNRDTNNKETEIQITKKQMTKKQMTKKQRYGNLFLIKKRSMSEANGTRLIRRK